MSYKKIIDAQKATDKAIFFGIVISAFGAGFFADRFLKSSEAMEFITYLLYGLIACGIFFMALATIFGLLFTKSMTDYDAQEERERSQFYHWNG